MHGFNKVLLKPRACWICSCDLQWMGEGRREEKGLRFLDWYVVGLWPSGGLTAAVQVAPHL